MLEAQGRGEACAAGEHGASRCQDAQAEEEEEQGRNTTVREEEGRLAGSVGGAWDRISGQEFKPHAGL